MTRIKSFATPHKGLRNVIAQFSLRLGYTDITDPDQLTQLKQLGQEMFTLLKDHVHNENEHTLTHLEERAPGASKHDHEDHERLETIQQSLEKQLIDLTGKESSETIHDLYLNFSSFQSQYLEHIFEEETVTELLLQKHFTDEELIQHRMNIMKRVELPILLLWLKYVVPAQNMMENIGLLSGFKANVPKEVFEKLLNVLRVEMGEERYQRLVVSLES
jgi:hypothetical protein